MSNISTQLSGMRFSSALRRAMRDAGLEIVDLAKATGITYEHIRKLSRGVAFPSKWALREICNVLNLDFDTMYEATVSDKIQMKYGGIPGTLMGCHSELSLLAPTWDKLTPEQKQLFKVQMASVAFNNDQEETVKMAS